MNQEFEAKFQIDNFEQIEAILSSEGQHQKTSSTHDLYFDIPEEVPHTKYLRIRFSKDNAQGILAYHEVVNDLLTNEWEVSVDQIKTTQEIINKLGFVDSVTVIKKREKYSFRDSLILLDTVENLGMFIEVESPSEEALNIIISYLKLEDSKRILGVGYPDLLKELK